tara:strand:+ start:1147 stop:1722 length:576 start_codon:yes stop_codon:yes gene_type:complete
MKNLICVSAPSGSGKTTLCKAIRKLRPELVWSVSCTTREPRNFEIDGEDYYFKTKEEFLVMIDKGEFAEWENVHGNYYGTLKSKLIDSIKNNETVLLELDVNGTTSIQNLYPKHTYSIFIIPPSINHLRIRLKSRGSETDETIKNRLKRFDKEMNYKDQFDTLLINDNIEIAIKDFITKVNYITKGVNKCL